MGSYLVNTNTSLRTGSHQAKVTLTPEEDMLICSTEDITITRQAHITLAKINTQGAVLWDRAYTSPAGDEQHAVKIELTLGGGYVISAYRQYRVLIGSVYSNKIVGHYYQDQNNNCLYNSNEPVIPYQVIAASGSNQNHYISTDSTGIYFYQLSGGKQLSTGKIVLQQAY